MLKLLKVAGNSLTPIYQSGDFVLIAKIPSIFGSYREGDTIAFCNPEYGTLLKIIERIIPESDAVLVKGTQPESIDSRRFGPVSRGAIMGKVIWHIKKPRS